MTIACFTKVIIDNIN